MSMKGVCVSAPIVVDQRRRLPDVSISVWVLTQLIGYYTDITKSTLKTQGAVWNGQKRYRMKSLDHALGYSPGVMCTLYTFVGPN